MAVALAQGQLFDDAADARGQDGPLVGLRAAGNADRAGVDDARRIDHGDETGRAFRTRLGSRFATPSGVALPTDENSPVSIHAPVATRRRSPPPCGT
jgi:hypothetical protein